MAIQIKTASEMPDERAAAARLSEILGGHDLRRFTYTESVLIDANAAVSHSHPVLTLGPRHVLNLPADVALTVFVHEQMHWAANTLEGTPGAIAEATRRWPAPPGPAEGGARGARSTWLHFAVCALEIAAMTALVGPERALAANRAVPWYRWIYDQLLGGALPWRDYLARWGLTLPPEPPAERDLHHAWVRAVDASALRLAVGRLVEPFAGARLDEDLLVRIVAVCCLRLNDHPDDAEDLDPMNADVYPVLRERGAEVSDTAARVRALRPPATL